MRYLITGAGMLGRALAARLTSDGHQAVLFDVAGEGVVRGDLRDIASIRPALDGIDGIFHTAAIHGWRDAPPRDFFEVNVDGTWNLYEAAVEAGVRKIVHSSTVGVYAETPRHVLDADTPAGAVSDVYGHTKWLSEQVGRHFASRCNLDWVALRYGGFAQIIEGRFGSLVHDWAVSGSVVDLDDVVEANVQAMRRLPLPRDAYLIVPSGGTSSSPYQVETAVTETDLDMTFRWTYDQIVERGQ